MFGFLSVVFRGDLTSECRLQMRIVFVSPLPNTYCVAVSNPWCKWFSKKCEYKKSAGNFPPYGDNGDNDKKNKLNKIKACVH